MPIVAAANLTHAFGDVIVLSGCSLSIEQGERIGVVGRNGCGKTTLLRAIAGQISPDSGTVSVQRGTRIGYLRQDAPVSPGKTLREVAAEAFAARDDLERRLADVFDRMAAAGSEEETRRLLREQERLEHELEAAGGYAVDHRIDAVLHGLGFTDAQFSIPSEGLSGGQRGRLALAKLLLEQPDVLLLDEPTNHLDIEGREWLESFITDDFRGAVVMISHDRYMLDRVVTRIVEIEQGRTIEYPGNYGAFREIRAQRRLSMLRAYENQQSKFRSEEAFIRRYKAGQRAKQARGRQTRLAREKADSTLERPAELGVFSMDIPRADRTGDVVLAARGLAKAYASDDGSTRTLFSGFDVSMGRAERWAVIGPNGAGKTTLVRCLLGDLAPDAGHIRLGSNVQVGYYRQTHDHLPLDLPVYRYLQQVILRECGGKVFSEQAARDLAGAFLFSGEEQERLLGQLSGGERSRAVLAGLIASAKNVLVLDEPTNHLDISSAERLEEALAPSDDESEGYDGSLILISHDRALIDATCDRLIVLDGKGNAQVFFGTYTQWHEREVARRRELEQAAEDERTRRETQSRKRSPAAPARADPGARREPTVNGLGGMSLEKLEARIETLQSRVREIDAALGSPDIWQDHERANRLAADRQRALEELEPLEFEWSRRAELG